jgi:dTDP-4-dehydrorhamnose reductase
VQARLIHVSTDYIFDGKSGPYCEDDRPNPLGFYARSKLAGENALINR